MRILLTGDSTVAECPDFEYPMSGWGPMLKKLLKEKIEVYNFAQGGATTESIKAVGLWDKLLERVIKDDKVIIQFGHNDQKVENNVSEEKYQENLISMIAQIREKSAMPVFCTSVERRTFTEHGFKETLKKEADIVKFIGQKENVQVIDLQSKSKKLYIDLGEEESKKLFTHFKEKENLNWPKGIEDNTHFCQYGAMQIAKMVLQELNI